MGFFDTVKDKANALASDAGRASKVTAAQARVVVLQSEVRKAERELGHAAFDLIERGELEPAGAAEAAARLREAHRALSDKEEEIAAIRAAAGDPQAAAGAAGKVTTAEPAPAPEAPGDTSAGGEAGADTGPATTEAPAAEQPARKPAPRKAAAKAPLAKPGAKKAGGARKTGADKTAAEKAGGAKTTGKPAARKAAGKSAGGSVRKKPPASST